MAYIGSWNWSGDTVCWAKYTTGKSGAEVGSHEIGHTLGLAHQTTPTESYYWQGRLPACFASEKITEIAAANPHIHALRAHRKKHRTTLFIAGDVLPRHAMLQL